MNQAFYKFVEGAGLSRLASSANRHNPVVLAFHGVTSDTDAPLHNSEASHLDRAIFERLIKWITRHYGVVPLTDIGLWLEGNANLPPRALAITFDDGYRNVLTDAAPILHAHAAPATLFVATDFVIHKRPLWPDRLRCALIASKQTELAVMVRDATLTVALRDDAQRLSANNMIRAMLKTLTDDEREAAVDHVLAALGSGEQKPWEAWSGYAPLEPAELPALVRMGVDIGSHTCSHPIVTSCTKDRMWREVSESRRLIENATGVPCRAFAYPNGAVGDFNAESRQLLVDAGYSCAVTTVKQRTTRATDRFEIPRMLLTQRGFTMSEFAVEVSGLPAFLRRKLGRKHGKAC